MTATSLRHGGEGFVSHDSGTGETPVRSAIDANLQLIPSRLFFDLPGSPDPEQR